MQKGIHSNLSKCCSWNFKKILKRSFVVLRTDRRIDGLLESSFAVVECTSTCLSRPVRSHTFPSEYKWLTNFLLSTALGFYKTKDT